MQTSDHTSARTSLHPVPFNLSPVTAGLLFTFYSQQELRSDDFQTFLHYHTIIPDTPSLETMLLSLSLIPNTWSLPFTEILDIRSVPTISQATPYSRILLILVRMWHCPEGRVWVTSPTTCTSHRYSAANRPFIPVVPSAHTPYFPAAILTSVSLSGFTMCIQRVPMGLSSDIPSLK